MTGGPPPRATGPHLDLTACGRGVGGSTPVIKGVFSGFDRLVFRGLVRQFSYTEKKSESNGITYGPIGGTRCARPTLRAWSPRHTFPAGQGRAGGLQQTLGPEAGFGQKQKETTGHLPPLLAPRDAVV